MELRDILRKRKMVRNFDEREVSEAAIERIVNSGRRAPSAGHSQGWAFLVLSGPEQVGRFWGATFAEGRHQFKWPGLFNAPLIIVPLSHKQAYLERYAEPDKGWTDRSEEHWPTPYWHVDTAFAAMLMQLTAIDEGLGCLFFGLFKIEQFRAAFGVPEAYHPIGALAIGHPAPDRPSPSLTRGRRSEHEVVHRGHW